MKHFCVIAFLMLVLAIGGFYFTRTPQAEAQPSSLTITDVEHAVDTDGTGSFTPARSSPCVIISNEDATATNSVTVTQTFPGGGSGTFVLRGGQIMTLGCTDRYPMFTTALSWVPDAGNPDVRVIAWEL